MPERRLRDDDPLVDIFRNIPEIRNTRRRDSPEELAARYGSIRKTPQKRNSTIANLPTADEIRNLDPASKAEFILSMLPNPSGTNHNMPLGAPIGAGMLPIGSRLFRITKNPGNKFRPNPHRGVFYFGATPRSAFNAAQIGNMDDAFVNSYRLDIPTKVLHPFDPEVEIFRRRYPHLFNPIDPSGKPLHWENIETEIFQRLLRDSGYEGALASDEAGVSVALLPEGTQNLRQVGSMRFPVETFRNRGPYLVGGTDWADRPYNKQRHVSFKFLQQLLDNEGKKPLVIPPKTVEDPRYGNTVSWAMEQPEFKGRAESLEKSTKKKIDKTTKFKWNKDKELLQQIFKDKKSGWKYNKDIETAVNLLNFRYTSKEAAQKLVEMGYVPSYAIKIMKQANKIFINEKIENSLQSGISLNDIIDNLKNKHGYSITKAKKTVNDYLLNKAQGNDMIEDQINTKRILSQYDK